jgi:oligosaccharide repeat unit polymerase
LKSPSSRFYIDLSDYPPFFHIYGPLFAFIFPWGVVLIGQLLALCKIIVPVYSSLYLIVLMNIFTLLCFVVFLQTFFPEPIRLKKKNVKIHNSFKKFTYFLAGIYILSQLFQMAYFKGFPLLFLLKGSREVNYVNFGIHSLQGFANAIYLVAITALFILFLQEKKKSALFLWIILSIFPILLVTRQLIISGFLQILVVALFMRPKLFLRFIAFFLAVLLLFIVLGNYRTGLKHLTDILEPHASIPKNLYPFLWIYAYVVTPFNNLNAVIDKITPLNSPILELSRLFPSFLRSYLPSIDPKTTGFALVHKNLTVSTFYQYSVIDFGRVWATLLMSFLQLLLVTRFRKAHKTLLAEDVIEYAVFYMMTFLSIFSNLFFFLPVVFQIVLLKLSKITLRRRKAILYLECTT